jgi:hypothetical protein
MKTNSCTLGFLLPFLVLSLFGCAGRKSEQASQTPPAIVAEPDAGISHQMIEVDHNGARYTNQPNRVVPVDAHSLLVIEFPKPAKAAPAPLSQNWKDLQTIIAYLNQRALVWKNLNERQVDLKNPEAVRQLQQEAGAAAKSALDLIDDLESLGINGVKMTAILSGRAIGVDRPRTPYLNLAQWATNNWNDLRSQAEAHQKAIESTSKVNVTVQAFRESTSGGRSLLHVDNWDSMPEGVYSPIDRTGLRPTEAEQKRLDMERTAAESVVLLINSARTNQDAFKTAFNGKLGDFKNRLDRIEGQLETLAKNWNTALVPGVLTGLDELGTSADPAVKAAAAALKTNVLGLVGIYQTVTNDIAAVRKVSALLVNPQSADPTSLLLGESGLIQTAEKLVSDLGVILSQIETTPALLQSTEANIAALSPAVRERATALVNSEFKTTLQEFRAKFPQEAEALVALWSVVNNSLGLVAAGDTLADSDSKLIVRTLDNLVPATVDLKRSGLALGDLVTMKLRATNAITGELVGSDTYQDEIDLMGLHGKPAVHLIFARALSGPSEATQWKANVAAAIEWHYTIRKPQTTLSKTWNWLYPGAGIHLASLNQGSDSFEIGAGGDVSFWDGLLTGGFGYNFSVKREYVWVGVNLLSALNQAKNVVGYK